MFEVFAAMKATPSIRKHQKLVHVGDCLYRSSHTDVYYASFQRDGKQVKRSLKTTDKELARRKMEDSRRKVGRISTQEARHLRFAEYDHQGVLIGAAAKQWIDVCGIEPSTRDRYLNDIRYLASF
jgi:hypothetical protein